MHRRMTLTNKASRFYGFSTPCVGNNYFHTKKTQTNHEAMSYSCLQENEKKEIDSSKSLRIRIKTQTVDEELKDLKSKLISLTGEHSKLKTENANNGSSTSNIYPANATSVIRRVHRSYESNITYSGGRVDVNPQYEMQKQKKVENHSDKKEFTHWLNSTIDSLNGTGNSNGDRGKDIPAAKNTISHPLNDDDDDDSDVDEHKVRQAAKELIYQSYLLKAYPFFKGTPVVEGVGVQFVNLCKRKKAKAKESKKLLAKKCKTSNEKQESGKVKTLTINDSSDSDVEVINIDDDSNTSSPVNNPAENEKDKGKAVKVIDNEITPVKGTPQEGNSCLKRVWECPICFEQNTGQEVVTTMCGHVFCKKCLDDYYVTCNRSCPTCRTDLHDKPVITLFNF